MKAWILLTLLPLGVLIACGDRPSAVCGNGTVEATETCDDGNQTTETCAYGETSCTVCDASCQEVAGETSFCGDGVVDPANAEVCDDGNLESGDDCDPNCTAPAPG